MLRIVGCLFLSLFITACGSDSWFGEKDYDSVKGKRISVLAHDSRVKTDVEALDANIVLPRPQENDSWPQAGGYSNHSMQHMLVGDNLKKAWKHSIGEGSSSRNALLAEPIIGQDKVFVIDTQAQITAFELDSGYEIWQKNITPEEYEDISMRGAGIAYEKDLLFVTTGFGKVYALKAKNGEKIWEKDISSPIRSAPSVNGGRVFVITLDNKVIALASNDGRELWRHEGITEATSLLGRPSVAVDDGVVIAPFSSGEIKALRVDSGSQLWADILSSVKRTDSIANLADVRARVVLDRGVAYAIGHNDLMVAIDIRTGLRIWEKEIGGTNQPWLAGKYLYVLSNDNEVICLSAKTGNVLWVTPLQTYEDEEDKKGLIKWVGPVLASDRLIVAGSNEKALALSPYTGKILGYEEIDDGVSSVSPTVAKKTLFFLNDDGDIVAYR